MPDSLKSKTINGVLWTGIDRILNQAVSFVISIILARLLTPSDYGVLGILNVCIGIASLFVDCGLTTGLLQKKNKNDDDYSTVFWCNILMSFLCYCIIFYFSPWIETYYNIKSLSIMLRVLGGILIINALYTIQTTRLTALIDFKSQAKVSFACCVLSGSIGLSFAYWGWGAWALVIQQLFASLFKSIAFCWISGWHPKFVFSKKSFNSLILFGFRIFAANIIGTIYNYLSPIIIGKKYSMSSLGSYTRADSLVQLPGSVFQSTFGRVIYPVLVSIQDDDERLREAYRKYLRIITSLVTPTMLILASVSESLILTLVGNKWIGCVPYVMLLAIAWMIDPIITVNLNILYVKGRSDIVLRLEFIKKAIAISIVVISVQFGVIWLCVGRLIYAYIALLINIYACCPFIGMSLTQQIKEIWIVYIGGLIAATGAYFVNFIILHILNLNQIWIQFLCCLIISTGVGGILYLVWAYCFDFEIIHEAILYLTKMLNACLRHIHKKQ